MSAIFDEDRQHIDPLTDALLVGGKIYIGDPGVDPIVNPKNIYDNRLFTGSPLAQPVIIDVNGRATSKMWVSGKYSLQIDSSADVQKYQELQNGFDEAIGNVQTTSSLGVNAITCTGVPVQTAYTDNNVYLVTAPADNTGAMTINIDGLGVLDIKKAHDQAIVSGDVKQDMKLQLIYNSTDGWMELQSAVLGSVFSAGIAVTGDSTFADDVTISGTVTFSKGADVASANALTLGSDGNYFDITGTTSITSITTIGIGTVVKLHFDAALTLTHHATDLILPGALNITTAAGDEAEFIEYATGDWRCLNYQVASFTPVNSTVTGHIRAGNTQILNGATDTVSFDVATNVTEGAFESIGPTGHVAGGGDNDWAELDVLPSNARILLCDLRITISTIGTGTATITFHALDGDSTDTLDQDANKLAEVIIDEDAAITGSSGIWTRVHIPLNSSQEFKVAWLAGLQDDEQLLMFYRGFMTD